MNKHINIITNFSQNKECTAPVLPYSLSDHFFPQAQTASQYKIRVHKVSIASGETRGQNNNEADATLPADMACERNF